MLVGDRISSRQEDLAHFTLESELVIEVFLKCHYWFMNLHSHCSFCDGYVVASGVKLDCKNKNPLSGYGGCHTWLFPF